MNVMIKVALIFVKYYIHTAKLIKSSLGEIQLILIPLIYNIPISM